jgi:MoaA/NifB/PqqE/SkfB family radical SAM enzyme
MLDTRPMLMLSNFPPIRRGKLDTLQVNLGYKCNLSCTHCHVGAGPNRTEMMSLDTVHEVLELLHLKNIGTLDLTGGAPELHPHFRFLVGKARELGVRVIDRCNLTVLLEEGQQDLAEFLASHQVEIVASLPCYAEQNVDKQRGKGVYHDSIEALKQLNQLGYGVGGRLDGLGGPDGLDGGLGGHSRVLNLVYNPGGPFLPPDQVQLERDYKRELAIRHGIQFDNLFVMTNMPITRFGSVLLSQGQFHSYMDLLKSSYLDANLDGVMCRNLISIDWQGRVYDCDFNQMLDIPLLATDKERPFISDILREDLTHKPVAVADHCYGCTAGQGSSCGGAL